MVGYGPNQFQGGAIEVVCGPMFSGKTEELIRRVRRAQIAKQRVQIFKPGIDDRYDANNVVSHSAQQVTATPVENSIELFNKVYDSTRIVAIDEVQFFDETIVKVIKKLARRGIRVICAGLDQDSSGTPFGPMPHLLAIADHVQKVQAVCHVCGAPATKSYRKPTDNKNQVLVGETDLYEARCRFHYDYITDEEEELLNYTFQQQVGNGKENRPVSQ